jgi:hypothetical protein
MDLQDARSVVSRRWPPATVGPDESLAGRTDIIPGVASTTVHRRNWRS